MRSCDQEKPLSQTQCHQTILDRSARARMTPLPQGDRKILSEKREEITASIDFIENGESDEAAYFQA